MKKGGANRKNTPSRFFRKKEVDGTKARSILEETRQAQK